MTWLSALAPLDGPRWSCAAYWAEDGNPQADDTDWGDSTTWDAAHAYDPDADLTLGLFVGGHDVTADVRSASWGLGVSGHLTKGISPSSAQLELQAPSVAAAGDRVCIATLWDVLWAGQVESAVAVSTLERNDTALTSQLTSVSCSDDLARGGQAELVDRQLGGSLHGLARTALLMLGIGGTSYDETYANPPTSSTGPGAVDELIVAARSGPILTVLSDALWACASVGAWTPRGLRLAPLSLDVTGWQSADVTDLADFREIRRGSALTSVRNRVTVQGASDAEPVDAVDDSASQRAYGLRVEAIDATAWVDAATSSGLEAAWQDMAAGSPSADEPIPGLLDPMTEWSGDARVDVTRHAIARLMPFDALITDDETVRVLKLSHKVSVEAWDVVVEGIGAGYDLIGP